jgi:hypothetical protein
MQSIPIHKATDERCLHFDRSAAHKHVGMLRQSFESDAKP